MSENPGAPTHASQPDKAALAERRVTAVVVSHNSRDDLERSLPRLDSGDSEVIVIDNASADGSAALVRDRFPDVQLVELTENVGYGAACNAGIARASGRFILVLNPDAWPLDDGIERLVSCAEGDPTLGAAGPELYSADGRRQQSLIGFPTRWWLGRPAITSTRSRGRIGRFRPPERGRSFLVGAALLLRREAIEEVGGFDPSFFMFFEEVDLCWRLQEAGWRVALCPTAKFTHVGGTSTRRDWAPMYREQLRGHLRFLAKHRGAGEAEFARKLLVLAVRVRALLARGAQQQSFQAAARWLGSADARSLLDSG